MPSRPLRTLRAWWQRRRAAKVDRLLDELVRHGMVARIYDPRLKGFRLSPTPKLLRVYPLVRDLREKGYHDCAHPTADGERCIHMVPGPGEDEYDGMEVA